VGTLAISFQEAALGGKRSVRSGGGGVVEIAIPSGVEAGGRLRVPGQGAAAPGRGGVPGDMYLDIEVTPDPYLTRNGLDIELEVPVSMTEAALGAKVEVPTVEGKVTVTVPPGTSSGARLRLRGRGVKKPDGARGDQICRVEIVAPKLDSGDSETRQLFEELDRRIGKTPVRKW
jgi:DnaJ-class molecular chaperone